MGSQLPRLGMAIVRGRSMLPTLRDGDRLLVRYDVAPRPGRVAVVRLPDGVVAVKRVATIDERGCWITSDNGAEGVDSSTVGAIAPVDVLARVLCRIWPRPRRRL